MAERKAAVITGSATGIGRAAAWRFAELGYDVVVNYSKSEAEAEETAVGVRERGGEALVVRADIAQDAEVRALIDQAVSTFGGLDVLVNNAAMTYFLDHRDLDGHTDTVWDEIFQLNLKGTFYACRAAMPHLTARRGSIVNVTSVAGVGGSGSSIAYAASKGAVNTLTKSLAKAFAPEVRVNAVAPGPVQTRWLADHQDMVQQAVSQTPLQRAATPEEIAETIAHLGHFASLTTGQVLIVDGGRTM